MRSVVYFIKLGDRIKVGTTTDLRTRFSALASSYRAAEIKLIGAIYGRRAVEQAIHKELYAFSLGNEFFRDDPIVRRVLGHLVETMQGAAGEAALTLTEPHGLDQVYAELDEKHFVNQAIADATDLISAAVAEGYSTAISIDVVSTRTGIPRGVLWSLKYRAPATVTAGISAALRSAVLGADGSQSE